MIPEDDLDAWNEVTIPAAKRLEELLLLGKFLFPDSRHTTPEESSAAYAALLGSQSIKIKK